MIQREKGNITFCFSFQQVLKNKMGDLESRKSVTLRLFREFDVEGNGELSPVQVQTLHEGIRLGGISLAQVRSMFVK